MVFLMPMTSRETHAAGWSCPQLVNPRGTCGPVSGEGVQVLIAVPAEVGGRSQSPHRRRIRPAPDRRSLRVAVVPGARLEISKLGVSKTVWLIRVTRITVYSMPRVGNRGNGSAGHSGYPVSSKANCEVASVLVLLSWFAALCVGSKGATRWNARSTCRPIA